MDAMQLSKT